MLVRVRPRWPKDGHSFTDRATSSVRERRVPTKPAMKFVTLADKTLLCMSDNKLLECEELWNLPNRLTNKFTQARAKAWIKVGVFLYS